MRALKFLCILLLSLVVAGNNEAPNKVYSKGSKDRYSKSKVKSKDNVDTSTKSIIDNLAAIPELSLTTTFLHSPDVADVLKLLGEKQSVKAKDRDQSKEESRVRPARESSDQQAQDENQPDVSEEERKNLFASDEQQATPARVTDKKGSKIKSKAPLSKDAHAPFTVFVPSNEAWALWLAEKFNISYVPDMQLSAIPPKAREMIRSSILYHIVPNMALRTEEITDSMFLPTLLKDSRFVRMTTTNATIKSQQENETVSESPRKHPTNRGGEESAERHERHAADRNKQKKHGRAEEENRDNEEVEAEVSLPDEDAGMTLNYEQQPVRERSNKQQRRMNQNQQPIKEGEGQDEEATTEAESEESKEQQPTSDDEETQTKKSSVKTKSKSKSKSKFVLRDAKSGLLRLVRAGNDVLIQFGLEAPTAVRQIKPAKLAPKGSAKAESKLPSGKKQSEEESANENENENQSAAESPESAESSREEDYAGKAADEEKANTQPITKERHGKRKQKGESSEEYEETETESNDEAVKRHGRHRRDEDEDEDSEDRSERRERRNQPEEPLPGHPRPHKGSRLEDEYADENEPKSASKAKGNRTATGKLKLSPNLPRPKFATVMRPEIVSSNGVIMVVDKVWSVPKKFSDMARVAGLNRFLKAIQDAKLMDKFDNSAGVTIFAPIDDAIKDMKGAGENNTNDWLLSHIVKGLYSAADLKDSANLKTMGNTNLPVHWSQSTAHARSKSKSKAPSNETAGAPRTSARSNRSAATNATSTSPAKTDTFTLNEIMIDDSAVAISDVPIWNGILHILAPPTKLSFNLNPCADKKCDSGMSCCNQPGSVFNEIIAQCFDPATHVCAAAGSLLCSKNTPLVCGGACFDPIIFTCFNGTLLCPAYMQRCGDECFDTARFNCTNGVLQPIVSLPPRAQPGQRMRTPAKPSQNQGQANRQQRQQQQQQGEEEAEYPEEQEEYGQQQQESGDEGMSAPQRVIWEETDVYESPAPSRFRSAGMRAGRLQQFGPVTTSHGASNLAMLREYLSRAEPDGWEGRRRLQQFGPITYAEPEEEGDS